MQDGAPFVSVIVPAYNLAEYTAEALRSIQAQAFTDFEAVIVDDGSTDGTVDVIKPYLEDSRFTLIQQPNQGTAAARNAAIGHARGEWIAFLDCDDLWTPDKLEKQVEVIGRCPSACLIFSNGMEFGEDGEVGPFYRKRQIFPDGNVLPRVLRCNCFWACSVMVRRRDVLDVGMLRVDLPGVDDFDLWIKILERGGEARGVWEPMARYRKRGDSQGLNKAVMLERLLRVYQDALERAAAPGLKAIITESIARVKSDMMLTEARKALAAGQEGRRACRKHIYRAWLEYPKRIKTMRLYALSLLGRDNALAGALARKW